MAHLGRLREAGSDQLLAVTQPASVDPPADLPNLDVLRRAGQRAKHLPPCLAQVRILPETAALSRIAISEPLTLDRVRDYADKAWEITGELGTAPCSVS